MQGKFYGVGVGPGDPELITLKGCRALKEADVICSPSSGKDKEGVALSVIEDLLTEKQIVLKLSFPMTKDKAKLELHWDKAVNQILDFLKKGKRVAFITLGDPSLYSTYTYVLRRIKQAGSFGVETIPGITSFSACTAAAGIPLAEGKEKLAVVPATADLNTLRFTLQNFENVVFMKLSRNYQAVADLLTELSLEDKAIYARRCGFADGFLKPFLGLSPEEQEEMQKDYLSLIIVKKENKR